METKIFGNENVTNTLTSMISSGRVAHAFLLFGENGLGKKTIAAQFAAHLVAIGNTSTHEINPMSNPDIIWVEHSGTKQGFSVETLRNLCVDAYILPNNGDKKVYILADCDNISVLAQNTLLKIIEEPPEFTHFIFTAQSKSVFLPTILSRIISLGVAECSEMDCRMALSNNGYTDEVLIGEAVSSFNGNIGMCSGYLEGGELRKSVEISRNITNSINNHSEYQLLKELTVLENNRPLAKIVFQMMDKIVRDSCIKKINNGLEIGCYPNGSKKLGETLSSRKALKLHDILNNAMNAFDGNVNMSIEMSAICGQILGL